MGDLDDRLRRLQEERASAEARLALESAAAEERERQEQSFADFRPSLTPGTPGCRKCLRGSAWRMFFRGLRSSGLQV